MVLDNARNGFFYETQNLTATILALQRSGESFYYVTNKKMKLDTKN